MSQLLHELLLAQAEETPQSTALLHREAHHSYEELPGHVEQFARALVGLGLPAQARTTAHCWRAR